SRTLLLNGPIPALSAWESPAELLALAAVDSPLSKFLAAYIWKRGELDRLKHVRAGLASGADDRLPPDSTDAAVMWAFGRHLGASEFAPIFDQHTYRACRYLHRREGRGGAPPAVCGDSRGAIPGREHLEVYFEWWDSAIFKRSGGDSRAEILYRMDQLLFSLGKAAPRMAD
ncbi:MAG: hypothetical protein ACRDQZ_19270, partial [Mycobacteriales bacterium]